MQCEYKAGNEAAKCSEVGSKTPGLRLSKMPRRGKNKTRPEEDPENGLSALAHEWLIASVKRRQKAMITSAK